LIVIFKAMFSRYWLLTLIVIAAVALCVWAAFWQMDRREQKRALNQELAERWDSPPFELNREPLPADVVDLQFRRVRAEGIFDYEHQIALKNDFRNEAPGVNLITPLLLPDGRAILVARGWVPLSQGDAEHWGEFVEPDNPVVVGLIKESQTLAGASEPAGPQQSWFRVDIAAIQKQMPYELLPAFLAMLPEPGRNVDALPIRTPPPELFDEWMHVGYTMQWFSFAAIGLFGYLPLLRYLERRRLRERATPKRPSEAETHSEETHSDLPVAQKA
jgi:cytochrome oxidase assembly protein ShyY1